METSNLLSDSPTYWEISDERWGAIQALLQIHDPPRVTGRRRIDQRAAVNAMIYRARTGCRWNKLPKHLPDDSSVHRTMQRWVKLGVFAEIWQIVVAPLSASETPGVAETPDAPPAPASGMQSVAAPAVAASELTEFAALKRARERRARRAAKRQTGHASRHEAPNGARVVPRSGRPRGALRRARLGRRRAPCAGRS